MNRRSGTRNLQPAGLAGFGIWVLTVGLLGAWLGLNPGEAKGLDRETDSQQSGLAGNSQKSDSLNLLLEPYPRFAPPNNGLEHRIMVIDQGRWSFIKATGSVSRTILERTVYALGPRDWAVWGNPVQTEFGNFYVLLVIRYGAAQNPHQLPRPVIGSTARHNQEIGLNRLIYRWLAGGNSPNPRSWNTNAKPRYSLQDMLAFTPPPVSYEPATEIKNGETAVKKPGRSRLVHELRVLIEIDGLAVDQRAISSRTVEYAQTRVIAIGVTYDNNHTVPEWQRPLLIEMAGIDPDDWEYVDFIFHHESRWKPRAKNPSSGAYGLCQSLPASKMKKAGDDYRDNAITQMRWCHNYAQERYGSWEQAYKFWTRNHWW